MRSLLKLLYAAARLYWQVARPVSLGVRLILVQPGRALRVRHSYHPGGHLARAKTSARFNGNRPRNRQLTKSCW